MMKKPTATQPRKKRTNYRQTRYDDAKRFAAISLAKQTNVNAAAKKLGIPPQTVDAWVKGFRCAESLQLWSACSGQLANACHQAAWDLMASVNAKIDDAPLNHILAGVKIAIETERLLRGQPTAINQTESVSAKFDLTQLTPDQLKVLRELLNVARCTDPKPIVDPTFAIDSWLSFTPLGQV